jgi:hypothetical protein
MKRLLLAAALSAIAASSVAQGASCICTAGCVMVSNPYAAGANQPTSCTVYKAGVLYANSSTVLSSTVPLSNAAKCLPADVAYNPGVAGSLACWVNVPPLIPGSYTLTMTATNGAGESPQSANFTFTSVAVLPAILNAPTGLRITMNDGEDAIWDVHA